MRHAFRIARTDYRAAERLIRGLDVIDEHKQQMLDLLANNHRHTSRRGIW